MSRRALRWFSVLVSVVAGAVLLLLALVGVFYTATQVRAHLARKRQVEQLRQQEESRPTNVLVELVKPIEFLDKAVLPGTTHPVVDVTYSAEISATVEKVFFREGATVSSGDLLVKLDTERLENRRRAADAAARLAELRHQRLKRVAGESERFVSAQELDQAAAERDIARAELDSVLTDIRKAEIRCTLESGIVQELFVEEGERVQDGIPLARVVDIRKVEVHVQIPERDIPFVRPGTKADVSFDRLENAIIPGVVGTVDPIADDVTHTFRVEVLLENRKGANGYLIRPGMIAKVSLVKQVIPNSITVPFYAVMPREAGYVVMIENNGRAHSMPVELGEMNAERIRVRSGLREGDRLIVSGQGELVGGQAVRVVAPEESEAGPK